MRVHARCTYSRPVPRKHPLGRGGTCPQTTQPTRQGHIQATREPRAHGLCWPLPVGERSRAAVGQPSSAWRPRAGPFSEEHGEARREARAEGPSGVGWGSRWWPRCLGSWGALLASASSVLVPASPPLGQLPAARPPRARASETPEPWDPQGHALSCQQTDPPRRAPGQGQAHTPRAVQGNADHGPRVAPPASGDIALRWATSGIAERTGSDGRLPLDMGFP